MARTKKITGSIFLALGVALIIFGSVVTGKVDQGKRKIHKAQRGVNTVRTLTSVSPYSQQVGKTATAPVQKKINQGKNQVKKFNTLSIIMFIVGGVLAVTGGVFIYMGFNTKIRRE